MQKTLGKIRSNYCTIRKIQSYWNNNHLLTLYHSMIQSHINYRTTTWLHGNKVIANKIKPPAKKTFNANDTKFTIHQTLIQKNVFYSCINTTQILFQKHCIINFFSKAANKNIVIKSNSQIISIYCTFSVSKQSVKFWSP